MPTSSGDRKILDQFDEYEERIRDLAGHNEQLLSDNLGLAIELERLREDLLRSERLRRQAVARAWKLRQQNRRVRGDLNVTKAADAVIDEEFRPYEPVGLRKLLDRNRRGLISS